MGLDTLHCPIPSFSESSFEQSIRLFCSLSLLRRDSMLPPVLERSVSRKQPPKPLDVLLRTLIKARGLHDLSRLTRFQGTVPLAS